MSIQVTPIPRLTAFAAPALTLGTANAAGSAETTIATDSTLLVFDTTLPAAVGTAATGSATVAPRRDHVHSGVTQATQAALEAETDQDTYAPPDLIKFSPGVAKVWVQISETGGLNSPDYGVSTIDDDGTGVQTVNFTTSFSSTVYSAVTCLVGAERITHTYNLATGSIRVTSQFADSPYDLSDVVKMLTVHGDL